MLSGVNGRELSHSIAPPKEGRLPSSGKEIADGVICCIALSSLIVLGLAGVIVPACWLTQASGPRRAAASAVATLPGSGDGSVGRLLPPDSPGEVGAEQGAAHPSPPSAAT